MISGRKPRLSADQCAELQRRYDLYRANRPKVLANEFGISDVTLQRYLTRKIKRYG